MVQLNEELVELLDFRAQHDGVSRSHVIRVAIEAYLGDDRERRLDRQIVEGYRRVPSGPPDEWGDPEAFTDRAALENLRALAEEERAAGHEPW